MGRPTKYRPEMCDTVREMGADGASKAEMAAALGIDFTTFWDWEANNEAFSKAVKDAMLASEAWWTREGREATFGKRPGFNATSYIFNMKNRFKDNWSDMKNVELSGPDGGPMKVESVTRTIVDPKDEK